MLAMSGSYAVTVAPESDDACTFLQTSTTTIDFRDIAKGVLESHQGPVTKDTVQKLESILKEKIEELSMGTKEEADG